MAKKSDSKKNSTGNNAKQVAKPAKTVVVKVTGPKPDFRPKDQRLSAEEKIQLAYNSTCTRIGKMVDGVVGTYGIKTEAGMIIVDLIHVNNKPVIYVCQSTVIGVTAHNDWFIPVTTLYYEELQKITSDAMFAWQVKAHTFLRQVAIPFFRHVKKTDEHAKIELAKPLTKLDEQALELAAKRRENKLQKKFVASKQHQNAKMVLAHMRKSCVQVSKIATGSIGYCDLWSNTGDLIVNFYFIGGDRMARVENIGKNHVLRLAGIKEGFSILASHIANGMGESDRQHMKEERFNQFSIFARHIREQMEVRGIRFTKKQTA